MDLDLGLPVSSARGIGWDGQAALASRAEDAGYEMVLVSESWGREAFTRLAALAEKTDRVRLGPGIVPVHSRSPTLLAQTVATLDEISGGRAFLGLGLSSPRVIEAWHGVEFEPGLRRQRETIEVVRLALSGDPVEYDGRVFDLEHFRLRFDPPRRDVPIYVAAQGPTNSELVGGFADGWMPNRIPRSGLGDAREHVDRGARTQGRDPDAVASIPFVTTCILDDADLARTRCRAVIAFYLGAMGEYHFEAVARGGFRETAREIRDRWESGDHEAAQDAVSDELLSEIAIAGSPDEAAERLAAYESFADTLVTQPPTTATREEIAETIEHVGALA